MLHEGGRVRMGTSDRVRREGSICWASTSSTARNIHVGGMWMCLVTGNDVGRAGGIVLFVNVPV